MTEVAQHSVDVTLKAYLDAMLWHEDTPQEVRDLVVANVQGFASHIKFSGIGDELPVSADWMETMSGLQFNPLAANPQFSLSDLVWGCARMPRFNGQYKAEVEHYSVAEHLVLLTRYYIENHLTAEEALEMAEAVADRMPHPLLNVVRTLVAHDLQEGLLGDMTRPIKRQDPIYRRMEEAVCDHLARRFDLIYPMPQALKDLDDRILVDERAQALNPSGLPWGYLDTLEPLGIELQFWSPSRAAQELFTLLGELGFDLTR